MWPSCCWMDHGFLLPQVRPGKSKMGMGGQNREEFRWEGGHIRPVGSGLWEHGKMKSLADSAFTVWARNQKKG